MRSNPEGTLAALVHDGRVLTESTFTEYIDAAFAGPPLRPDALVARCWMRFFDAYFGPSLSMIGWSVFVGPAMRGRDPAELAAAIERIPLPARCVVGRKALFNERSAAELAQVAPPGGICDRRARGASGPADP